MYILYGSLVDTVCVLCTDLLWTLFVLYRFAVDTVCTM